VVGDQVTDDRPAPLSSEQVAEELQSGQTPATTTAPDGGTSTSAPPADPSATTSTYRMQGGVATLRFSAAGVEVVGASPAEGFTVDTEPEHGNGVRVEFESDAHRSRVDAWWDGGPQVERREDGETVDAGGDRGPGSGDEGSGGGSGPG
jgi:hypothetical protein